MVMYLAFGNVRHWLLVGVTRGYGCGLGWFLSGGSEDSVRLHFFSWFAPSRFAEFLVGVYLARVFLVSPGQKLADLSGVAQAMGILLINRRSNV